MSDEQVKKVYVLTWGYSFFKSDGKDIILPEDIFVFDTESTALEAMKERIREALLKAAKICINAFKARKIKTYFVKIFAPIFQEYIVNINKDIPLSLSDGNRFIANVYLKLNEFITANRSESLVIDQLQNYFGEPVYGQYEYNITEVVVDSLGDSTEKESLEMIPEVLNNFIKVL